MKITQEIRTMSPEMDYWLRRELEKLPEPIEQQESPEEILAQDGIHF